MGFITGVDFVAVPAKDFDASMDFYGRVLGLEFRKRWGTYPGAEFQIGNLTLAIMEPTAFGQEFHPHRLPVAIHVDDFDEAKRALAEAGVEFRGEVLDSGVCYRAFFNDPAGNQLEIHHGYNPEGA
jgi:predicted enzyme related to lactoylglutathione lyase